MEKIHKIEISFPLPVELPDDFGMELDKLVNTVCKKYEKEHPGRVMWLAGHGAKILWRGPEEPDFDENIYQITVAEREDYKKDISNKEVFEKVCKSLSKPHDDCHYYEENIDDFDSCPVTKHGKSEISIHCGKCQHNPFRNKNTI